MEPNKTVELVNEILDRGVPAEHAMATALLIRMNEVEEKIDRILAVVERRKILDDRGIRCPW